MVSTKILTVQIPLGIRKDGRFIYRIAGGSEPAVEQQPQGQQLNNGGTGQQQQQNQNAAPYAEYLEKIPEGLRNVVEPIFKEWDGNVTRRFQEASSRTAEYQPYQSYIDQYEPEALGEAIQIAELLSTPQGAQQIYQQLHQMYGGQQPEQELNNGENEPNNFTQAPEFKQIQEVVSSLSENFEKFTQSQQEQVAMQEAEKEWNAAQTKYAHLISNADGSINEDASNMVLSLAISSTNGDIDKAFQQYANAVGKQAMLQNQPGRAAPIVGGGAQNQMPSNNVDPAQFTEAQRKEAALAIVRANNQQR